MAGDGKLSPEARKVLSKEMVFICERMGEGGVLYSHEEFLGAFQDAILHQLSASVPPGASARTAMRALARMRSSEKHKATLDDALARLKQHGTPIDPSCVAAEGRYVVAVLAANA